MEVTVLQVRTDFALAVTCTCRQKFRLQLVDQPYPGYFLVVHKCTLQLDRNAKINDQCLTTGWSLRLPSVYLHSETKQYPPPVS